MLEKFLNKKVLICIMQYGANFGKGYGAVEITGTVTKIDSDFIELDNNEIIAIRYIYTIKFL